MRPSRVVFTLGFGVELRIFFAQGNGLRQQGFGCGGSGIYGADALRQVGDAEGVDALLVLRGVSDEFFVQVVGSLHAVVIAQFRVNPDNPCHIGAAEQAVGGLVARQQQVVLFAFFVFFHFGKGVFPFGLRVNAAATELLPHVV